MRDEFFEPQFKSDSDDAVARCPYCKYAYQPEADEYSEDTREKECFECGKKFYLHQEFMVTHYVKPDCELNGQQHKWDFLRSGKTGVDQRWQSCDVCNKFRDVTASEDRDD